MDELIEEVRNMYVGREISHSDDHSEGYRSGRQDMLDDVVTLLEDHRDRLNAAKDKQEAREGMNFDTTTIPGWIKNDCEDAGVDMFELEDGYTASYDGESIDNITIYSDDHIILNVVGDQDQIRVNVHALLNILVHIKP